MKDYKRILQGVVNIINITKKSDIGFANICAYINEKCPELKESEDEKIRKGLINGFNFYSDQEYWGTEKFKLKIKDIIAWLEKQSNNISLPKFTFEDVIALQCVMGTIKKVKEDKDLYEQLKSLHDRVHDAYWIEKQGEQKPITHKYNVGATIYYNSFGETKSMVVANVVDTGDGNPMYEDADGCAVFEKDIVELKPAWSVEDEVMIKVFDSIIKYIVEVLDKDALAKFGTNREELFSWFKSLKERYTWKPSDKQMHYLSWIANIKLGDSVVEQEVSKHLNELLEDLKKLREE